MRRVAVTIVALALAFPAAAAAQLPPAPTPTPTPAPAPPPSRMSMAVEAAHRVGHDLVALRGDRLRVRGAVSPFVPGQKALVRVYRNGRRAATKTVAIRQAGADGAFVVSLKAGAGRLTVRASHRATPQQGAMAARPARVLVISPSAGPGARGPTVRILQTRLATLHYAVSRSGVFDASTGRALIAYRKMRGWSRVAVASRDVLRGLLAGRGTFKAKHPEHGKHVEADLSRQVLVLLNGARVHRIYTVSSGKPSTPTVLGRFKVYSKTIGTNSHGMVNTSYFIGGYAIHGYAEVPAFPASHGCLRVPIPSSLSIYRWLRIGDRVDVYP
jgi:peptidoglycan hydrolase-like protein with peptidoglycan-binding domain